jgi:hypothetical protein
VRSRSGEWLDIALAVLGIVMGTMWWLLKVVLRVLLLVTAALVGFVIGLKLSKR